MSKYIVNQKLSYKVFSMKLKKYIKYKYILLQRIFFIIYNYNIYYYIIKII